MTGVNVLIVDDEKAIRDGLSRVLTSEGFSTELSDSGYSALEKLQIHDFQLVITDLKMPGMSGMEVLNAITILQPNVPVILITGYSTVENAVEVMKRVPSTTWPNLSLPTSYLKKLEKLWIIERSCWKNTPLSVT